MAKQSGSGGSGKTSGGRQQAGGTTKVNAGAHMGSGKGSHGGSGKGGGKK